MKLRSFQSLLTSGLFAMVFAAGCSSGGTVNDQNKPDASSDVKVTACTPNAASCVNASSGEVCRADGSGYASFTCKANEKCDQGACKLDPNATACRADTKECVTDEILRICAKDGSGFVQSACPTYTKCTKGECVFDKNSSCTPGEGTCVSGTPLRCKDDGSGFDTTPCPEGTKCAGPGLCQGVCVVGASFCSGSSKIATCPDGKAYVLGDCPTGNTCVDLGDNKAACKPKKCNSGDQKCGNLKDPAADQTKFMSICVETPEGLDWAPVKCDGNATCKVTSDLFGVTEQCSLDCKAGQTTCNANQQGIVGCGNNGTWNQTPTTICPPQQLCVQVDGDTAKCGDIACAEGKKGLCLADGRQRPCVDGKLGDPVTCTNGACDTATGQCKAICVDGDTKCSLQADGSIGTVECKNGKWETALKATCSSALGLTQKCIQLPAAPGRSNAVCGDTECATSCSSTTGACSGFKDGFIGKCLPDGTLRVCANGKLASGPTACGTGFVCGYDSALGGETCIAANCIDGETVCTSTGSTEYRTCVGGVLSTTTKACPVNNDGGLQTCVTATLNGKKSAICGGECTPGQRRCQSPSTGGDAGDASSAPAGIQFCGNDGKWGAVQTCTVGKCTGSAPSAICQADCIPDQKLCGGTSVTLNGLGGTPNLGGISATNKTGNCTTQGLFPSTYTDCGAGTYCRKDSNNTVLGCVQCVGGGALNERKLVDSVCSNATGATSSGDAGTDSATDSGTAVSKYVCAANNTWDTAFATSCNGGSCAAPTTTQGAMCTAPQSAGGACDDCIASKCTTESAALDACTTSTCTTYKSCIAACKTLANSGSSASCCFDGCWKAAGGGSAPVAVDDFDYYCVYTSSKCGGSSGACKYSFASGCSP